MHIVEGILTSTPTGVVVLGTGFLLSGIGIGIGLHRMDNEDIPRAGVLAAAFFVVSLVPIPVGVGSVHLLLTGLMGILLGWGAFPAIAVALALQAVFFGDGGLSALGVNTLSMGLPAVICGMIFGKNSLLRKGGDSLELTFDRAYALRCGFFAGVLAVLLGVLITASALVMTNLSLSQISLAFLLANLALAPIEGLVTATTLAFVCRVQPSLLAAE